MFLHAAGVATLESIKIMDIDTKHYTQWKEKCLYIYIGINRFNSTLRSNRWK